MNEDDDLLKQPDHATPIDPDERRHLKLPIFDRQQLNEAEAANITAGSVWAFRSRRDWWTDAFLCELHRRMFKDVWKWAGKYRETDKNIGNVPVWRVPSDVRQVLDDAKFRVDNKSFEPHELAVRLHRDLVWIHPFHNGNGRCTRLVADVVLLRLKAEPLTWGGLGMVAIDTLREDYFAALRAADNHDFGPLLAFARSR